MTITTTTAAAAAAPIRILCFGASITAGWTQLGLRYHPYARTLEARLRAAFPTNPRFSLQTDGLPGDTVVAGLYPTRLRAALLTASNASAGGRPYDWIIVQGGGNDLLSGREPEEVWEGLRAVWGVAGGEGGRVVALTVTKAVGVGKEVQGRYEALNGWIVGEGEGREGVRCVDVAGMLEASVAGDDGGGAEGVYDRDGVHLTRRGYECKASLFFWDWCLCLFLGGCWLVEGVKVLVLLSLFLFQYALAVRVGL